jgi:hypothetical protein
MGDGRLQPIRAAIWALLLSRQKSPLESRREISTSSNGKEDI